jgi:hypothetical protein
MFKLSTISPAGCRSQQARRETVSQATLYFGTDMIREGTGVRAAGHVLLLPCLRIPRQQDARRSVGEEDRNRVVVGLAEELARRRSFDVR